MWPFGRRSKARLAECLDTSGSSAPSAIDFEGTVTTANTATSPLTSMRAAAFLVHVLERIPMAQGESEAIYDHYVPLGTVVVGDTLALADADGTELLVVARRAHFSFATEHRGGTPLARIPPEIAPFLRNASGRGVLCFRELAVSKGDRFRVSATVEPVRTVVSSGYRSDVAMRFIAREDAPVRLEEIFERPPF